jgi:hypothetical protein
MQPVTAEQAAILTSPSITVTAGLERLNAALQVVEDISDDLEAGSVSRSLFATVHGTCEFAVTRELRWGVDLVRPFMVLTDTTSGASARWNVGVYCLTTPESVTGETPRTYRVRGYDRLHLLQRQVGADYSVTAGTTYRHALLDVFAAAGLTGVLIDGSAATLTVPVTRSWPLVGRSTDPDQTTSPVTFLRVINDLLAAINYRSVWADQDGVFRCQQYAEPAARPVEFTFDTDTTTTIVGEERSSTDDVWSLPNRWLFRWQNAPAGTPLADLTYEVSLPATDPLSAAQRGLVWTSVVDREAASRAALVAIGDAYATAERRGSRTLEVTTGPLPAVGHADVYLLRDNELGELRVQNVSWSFDLSGSEVTHRWEVVR